MGAPESMLLRAAALALFCASAAAAPAVTETVQLTTPSNTTYGAHRFGYATALSPDGQTLAVGAPSATGAGAVYMYARGETGWGTPQRLDRPADSGRLSFGAAIALSNDVLVVGDPEQYDFDLGGFPGGVFVYRKVAGGWLLEQELAPPAPTFGQDFGLSVAVDGDTIFVGVSNPERVYVYERGEGLWEERQILEAFDGLAYFGESLAIDGDRAVVGAPWQSFEVNVPKQGAAYTFVRTAEGWVDTGKLIAADTRANDEFGTDVAIEGDMIVIGAAGRGAAFVFRDDAGWSQQYTVSQYDERFGTSVDIDNGTFAVGAPGPDFTVTPGHVYYYEPAGLAWVLAQTLEAQGSEPRDRFGTSVALVGDQLVASSLLAPIDGRIADGIVAAYTRQLGAWLETEQLHVEDGAPSHNFGEQIAIDGDVLVVASPYESNQGIRIHGAVYVHARTEAGWQIQQVLTDSCGGKAFGGSALVVSGDVIAAAGRCGDLGAGAVSVFRFNGEEWALEQLLLPDDPSANPSDSFGRALALDGNTLVVGSSFAYTGGVPTGAAYIFEYAGGTWSQVRRLVADDGLDGDYFGTAAAIDGSSIVIAARDKRIGFNNGQGAVYIFGRDDGQQRRRITLPEGNANEYFGCAVAFTGDDLAVGAFSVRSGLGAVYVVDPATGLVKQTLVVGGYGEQLGYSVVANDDMIVASRPRTRQLDGEVHVFVREADTWTLRTPLRASDTRFGLLFGSRLAISGDRLAVGVPVAHNRNGQEAGKVYLFDNLPPPAEIEPPLPVEPTSPGGGGGPMPLGMAVLALAAILRRR